MSDAHDELRVARSLAEAIPQLRRPFAPEAIGFIPFREMKQRREDAPFGAELAAFVEALTVIERLDLIVPDKWETDYVERAGIVFCRLTIFGITRTNSAEGDAKDVASKALKRAAMLFGVGQYLRRMSTVPLYVERGTHRLLLTANNKIRVPEAVIEGLRSDYARWLVKTGTALYGPVLVHGPAEPDVEELDVDPDTGEVLNGRSLEHLPGGDPQQRLTGAPR